LRASVWSPSYFLYYTIHYFALFHTWVCGFQVNNRMLHIYITRNSRMSIIRSSRWKGTLWRPLIFYNPVHYCTG
jgi:hypothetical protein